MRSAGRRLIGGILGPTETDDSSEAWKERLYLLDDAENDEMERVVARKLEEMKSRVLAWDPDKYTEAFRHELKKRKEEKTKGGQAREAND